MRLTDANPPPSVVNAENPNASNTSPSFRHHIILLVFLGGCCCLPPVTCHVTPWVLVSSHGPCLAGMGGMGGTGGAEGIGGRLSSEVAGEFPISFML